MIGRRVSLCLVLVIWQLIHPGMSVMAQSGTQNQTISFQVSPYLAYHEMKLWQVQGGVPVEISPLVAGQIVYDGWQGYEIGYTISYFELTANFDPAAGDFWLEDVSSAPSNTSPKNRVGLMNAEWRTTGDTQRQYFAVPEDRAGHVMVLVQPGGGSYLAADGNVQQWVDFDEYGNRVLRSYGFAEAWAQRDPANPHYYLIDYTAGQQSIPDTANLAYAGAWTAFTGSTPTHAITFKLPPNEGTRTFTLHVLNGSTQSLRAVIHGTTAMGSWYPDSFSSAGGIAGVGMEYWLVRDQDGAASGHMLMGFADQVIDWSTASPFPDIGAANSGNLQGISLMVNADTPGGHQYVVYHASGLRVQANWVPSSEGGEGYITDYDDFGNVLTPFHFAMLTCDVDQSTDWWLVDEGVTPPREFPIRATTAYDGWTPHHSSIPSGQMSLYVNADRYGHNLRLAVRNSESQQSENWTIHPAVVDYYDGDGNFTGSGEQWGTQDFYDSDGNFMYTASYFVAAVPYDGWSSWTLSDCDTNEVLGSGAGSGAFVNLVTAYARQSISLNISATRWGHALYLQQPGQPDVPLTPGSIQGVWSHYGTPGASGYYATFTNYGFFDASVRYFPAFGWTIYDAQASDSSSSGQDLTSWISGDVNLDSDGDGLPDWYESIIGTSSDVLDNNGDGVPDGQDSDGDGVSDYIEMTQGTNPTKAPPKIIVISPAEAQLLP